MDMTVVHQQLTANEYMYSEVDLQLKATKQTNRVSESHVSIQLKKAHYDKLRTPHVQSPRLLVVMRLPEDLADWLSHTDEMLTLSHCCYWMSLLNMAPIVEDRQSKVVHVPRANKFNVETLLALMHKSRLNVDLAS